MKKGYAISGVNTLSEVLSKADINVVISKNDIYVGISNDHNIVVFSKRDINGVIANNDINEVF